MGPSGGFLEPLGLLTAAEVTAAYGRQAAALAAGGADALVLETFYVSTSWRRHWRGQAGPATCR